MDKQMAQKKKRGSGMWSIKDKDRYNRDRIEATLAKFKSRLAPSMSTPSGIIKHVIVPNLEAILDIYLPPEFEGKN